MMKIRTDFAREKIGAARDVHRILDPDSVELRTVREHRRGSYCTALSHPKSPAVLAALAAWRFAPAGETCPSPSFSKRRDENRTVSLGLSNSDAEGWADPWFYL